MDKTTQWEKAKQLFEAGLLLEPAQRSAFLRDACSADEALRVEVESLFSAYDASDNLSQLPWTPELLGVTETPKSIGPYRLLRRLGEGGMGQVWLAEQSAPLHRQVALKLIRAGMYDDALLHRFQAERQSLAMMDHPTVAKIFDAGATADGQPYFVMEYVPGEPITEYCDRQKLTIRDRLELFVRACEGVQHAHQKAIIHRDLKPPNILVTEVDGKPMPRIIDFGLAKAATGAAGEELFTQVGVFVGTPGYMSPEQADAGAGDIDTRTDVYSLGVVLYELLTGLLPFDTKEWRKQPLHETLRQLREVDPPRPSIRVGKSSTVSAELRGTEPKELATSLEGDLDWVTMKAIAKDRGQRYGTPSELAADIERFLRNEPVLARPASTRYRLQKYLRRHRVGTALAAGVLLLLGGFAVVEAVQLHRITSERDRATRERDRAGRITDFMTGMFKVSDPSEARGNSITAREILDKASKEIDPGLAKDPELQAQMMYVMGRVYDSLGLYPRAEALFRSATDIRQHVLGEQSPETLTAMLALAWTYYHEGRYPEAEGLARQTLEIQRRVLGPDNPDTLMSMGRLAVILSHEGHYAQAAKLQSQVLEFRRRVLGPEHPDTLVTMNNLGIILQQLGRYDEAEHLDRQVSEIEKRIHGLEYPGTLMPMSNLSNILYLQGRYAEAETLAWQTIDIERRILGPEHPQTLNTMNSLSATLNAEGKYAEAAKIGREVLELRTRVLGPEHPETLQSMSNLADTLTKQGNYSEAEKLLRRAIDIQRRVLGPDHPHTALSVYNLACVAAHRGRRDQALSLLRQSVDHGLPVSVCLGMAKDPDLKSLHGDSRFETLVSYARDRALAQKNQVAALYH